MSGATLKPGFVRAKPPSCPACGAEAALDATDGRPVDILEDGWIVRFSCKECEARWTWRPYVLSSSAIPIASDEEHEQDSSAELPKDMDEILGMSLAEIFASEPSSDPESEAPKLLRAFAEQLEADEKPPFVLIYSDNESLSAITTADEADEDTRREIMNALTGIVIRLGGSSK